MAFHCPISTISHAAKQGSVFHRALFVLVFFSFGLASPFSFGNTPPADTPPAPSLPRLNIDDSAITVSGLSSGAYMAVQLHIAHSSLISGAGVMAGGPFWCAQGEGLRAIQSCMNSIRPIDLPKLVAKAHSEAAAGRIDDLKGLANDRVWLFAGTKDKVLLPAVAQKLKEFYQAISPGVALQTEFTLPAGHGIPTLAYGAECGTSGSPYILNCAYDGAEKLLTHLYGTLKPAVAPEPSHLFSFDQKEFSSPRASLYDRGWIYTPKNCRTRGTQKCKLHIALHGCAQNPSFIQDRFETQTGYNRWAEANDIVILYPKATSSRLNPNGCWDWFGYTGPDYMLKSGKQIRALKAMIDRVRDRS